MRIIILDDSFLHDSLLEHLEYFNLIIEEVIIHEDNFKDQTNQNLELLNTRFFSILN